MAYLLLLALIAFGVPLGVSLRDRVNAEVRDQAHNQAEVLAASAPNLVGPARRATLGRLVNASANAQRGRVVVVDSTGNVIADSSGPGEIGGYYGDRPEIATAFGGHEYQQQRDSRTLGTRILATAEPISRRGKTIGAVRITQNVSDVTNATRSAIVRLAILGGIVLLLGVIAAALIARATANPIRRLEEAAHRVEGGDLEAAAPIEGTSEQKALARSFNRMTARLARLLRGQQAFVADASHQLRTPLTGIRLRLEELREELPEGDARAHELDAGMAEVDRLSHIVDELLVLSQAGEHELPGEEVDVDARLDRARERWSKAADEHGLELHRDGHRVAATCWCSPADLDRALDSLIENAIRYSPEGGEVTIAVGPGRIEVLDRGPGLAPGEEEMVFERFYRGSAGRGGVEGTGLGLPIARELAEQWNGSVRIENREGGGTRAIIEMPAYDSRDPAPIA